MTVYDGAYVATAEVRELRLITDDEKILDIASSVARSLASVV